MAELIGSGCGSETELKLETVLIHEKFHQQFFERLHPKCYTDRLFSFRIK